MPRLNARRSLPPGWPAAGGSHRSRRDWAGPCSRATTPAARRVLRRRTAPPSGAHGAGAAGGERRLQVVSHEVDDHPVKRLVEHADAPVADHRPEDLPMSVGVREELATEGEKAFRGRPFLREGLTLDLLERRGHRLEPRQQQVFLVVEVGVEGRATDVGAVDDLLHGQRRELPMRATRASRSSCRVRWTRLSTLCATPHPLGFRTPGARLTGSEQATPLVYGRVALTSRTYVLNETYVYYETAVR